MNEHVAGLFDPVRLTCQDEAIYSVDLRRPSPVTDELERYAALERTLWDRAAEEALMFYRESFMSRADFARENVEWTIRNFGPPRPRLSRKRREELNQRKELELAGLRAGGSLGNLILPVEVYSFVRRNIADGTFASPTDVIAAAMPFLWAEQAKPKRAEIVSW